MKSALVPIVTLALLLSPAWVSAQDARPSDRRTDQPQTDVDPDVEFWVLILAQRLADENPTIRNSAQKALVAVGRAALPTLRNMADTWDANTAEHAEKVIKWIQKAGRDRRLKDGAGLDGLDRIWKAVKKLDMSDDQIAQLKDLHQSHMDEARIIRQQVKEGVLDREAARASMAALREQLKGELGRFLTPDQFERFRKMRDRPRPPRKDGGRFDRAFRELDLTTDQRSRFEEIRKIHRERSRELRLKAKDGGLDREAVRAALEVYREELKGEMRSFLTPKQMEKLEEGMQRRGDRSHRGDRRMDRRRGERRRGSF
ncbi:MAG: hypothetical protein O7H41_18460 [Planctomycetota bacterium]|nr:hypothetical protein [Planctomycetota bacterium]